MSIKEEDIRWALNIKDALDHHFRKGDRAMLKGFVEEMGYDIEWKTLEKRYLPPYWRLLFHRVAHYLSDLRGGFDSLMAAWVE